MQAAAVIEHQPTDPAPKRPATKAIGRALKHAIRLLLSGECSTVKAAAERANLTREHLSKCLGLPHVQAFIDIETRKTISSGKMLAGARLLQLVHASSEHVSLDAAKHVLAIEGIKPSEDAQIVNNINLLPGYVLDLNPAQVIEHQPAHTQSVDPVSPGTDGDER